MNFFDLLVGQKQDDSLFSKQNIIFDLQAKQYVVEQGLVGNRIIMLQSIKQNDLQNFLINYIKSLNNKFKHIEINFSQFSNDGSQILIDVANYLAQNNLILKLDNLDVKFNQMNWNDNQSLIVTDFLKFVDPNINKLSIDIKQNLFTFEGLSQILDRLCQQIYNLKQLEMCFSKQLNEKSQKKDQICLGLQSCFKLKYLTDLTLDLSQNHISKQFFEGISSQKEFQINSTLRRLKLIIKYQDEILDLSCLQHIFKGTQNLKKIQLILTNTYFQNIELFMEPLSSSNLSTLQLDLSIFQVGPQLQLENYEIIAQQQILNVFAQLIACKKLMEIDFNLKNHLFTDKHILMISNLLNQAQQLHKISLDFQQNQQIFNNQNYSQRSILQLQSSLLNREILSQGLIQIYQNKISNKRVLLTQYSLEIEQILLSYIIFQKITERYNSFNPKFAFQDFYF
ncbi:hypothetical protein ABPG74_013947 [Tetrahymena malaccensis]